MIKAYLVGISTLYENEDVEVRYQIYKDQEVICKKKIFQDYRKPLLVSHVALLTLLKELEKYKKDEIVIVINDPALNEQIRGTSTTQNPEVLKMLAKVKQKLNKFSNSVTIQDVSGNREEFVEWNDILEF